MEILNLRALAIQGPSVSRVSSTPKFFPAQCASPESVYHYREKNHLCLSEALAGSRKQTMRSFFLGRKGNTTWTAAFLEQHIQLQPRQPMRFIPFNL